MQIKELDFIGFFARFRRLTPYSQAVCGVCVLLIAVLSATGYALTAADYRRTVDERILMVTNLAVTAEELIGHVLKDADKELFAIKQSWEQGGLKKQALEIRFLEASERTFQGVAAVFDSQGKIIISSKPDLQGKIFTDRAYFQVHQAQDTQTVFIDRPIIGRTYGLNILPATRRISQPEGSFGGIVYIGLHSEDFLNYYKKMDLGENQLMVLAGLDGIVRARRSGDNFDAGMDVSGRPLIANARSRPWGSYISKSGIDGIERVISYRRVEGYPLVVAVGQSTEVALAGYRQRSLHSAFGLSMVFLVIISLTRLLVRRHEAMHGMALHAMEERNRLVTLVESISDEVWFIGSDQRVVAINSAAKQKFGEKPVGRDILELAGSLVIRNSDGRLRALNDAPPARSLQGEVIANELEEVFVPMLGQWRMRSVSSSPLKDDSGNIFGAVSVARDITDQYAAERELLASKMRYQAIMQQSTEAVALCEFPSLQICEVNKAAEDLLGYTENELLTMNAADFFPEGQARIHILQTTLSVSRCIPTQVVKIRHKQGHTIMIERTGSLIVDKEQPLVLLLCHNISAERLLQQVIRDEVTLAGNIQKAMLPGDFENEKVMIQTGFAPMELVSGDCYGYRWSEEGQLLNGFILDVTGHGVTSALQAAAVSAMFNEEMAKGQSWSYEVLAGINSRISAYLSEGSFVAALVFSLDFSRRKIDCISAGINHFLVSNREIDGWFSIKGSFLGISGLERFSVASFDLQCGDSLCFVTDGVYNGLLPEKQTSIRDFPAGMNELHQGSIQGSSADDYTYVGIKIKSFSEYPRRYVFTEKGNWESVELRMRALIDDIAGTASFMIKLAVGEGLSNALRHGTRTEVKIARIGSKLVCRIRDNGTGFDGNAAINRIRTAGARETLHSKCMELNGRGIPIMMEVMDKVVYNRHGNEVLLMKRI